MKKYCHLNDLLQISLLAILILATNNCSMASSAQRPAACPTSGQALIEAIKIHEPLTFCGEQVPLKEDDVMERLERELLICLDNSDDIIIWLKRANRYLSYVEKTLLNNSMPDDLKYIVIAESSLRTHAVSGKGAVGYWQFIESTAAKYGLTVNKDIDERRNFFLSTQAALRYLKDLYGIFGSWTLAAAAYNMGEDGLKTEILIQGTNNFYQLYLYQETQRYIFRILAIKIILSNPEKYGYLLTGDDLYKPLEFTQTTITANQPVPLSIVAQAAKTHFKAIKELNPQLRNYYLPAGSFTIYLPRDGAIGFSERYENLLSAWFKEKKERIYVVQEGDNLALIAGRFNVSVKALLLWNGLNNTSKLIPGQKLVVFSEKITPSDYYNGKNSPENDSH